MSKRVTKKDRRRLLLISFIIVVLLGVLVAGVFKDWLKIIDNKKQISALTENYSNLINEEESLKSEVTKLQNPDYVARYARENYLYSKPNEVIIKSE